MSNLKAQNLWLILFALIVLEFAHGGFRCNVTQSNNWTIDVAISMRMLCLVWMALIVDALTKR